MKPPMKPNSRKVKIPALAWSEPRKQSASWHLPRRAIIPFGCEEKRRAPPWTQFFVLLNRNAKYNFVLVPCFDAG